MFKYILLIALLFPTPTLSHEWNQHRWLSKVLTNHNKIIVCWRSIDDKDVAMFHNNCPLWDMGSMENEYSAQYHAARDVHPTLNFYGFVASHFPHANEDSIDNIMDNIILMGAMTPIFVRLYTAEGIMLDDK